jgi:hypothetical protein
MRAKYRTMSYCILGKIIGFEYKYKVGDLKEQFFLRMCFKMNS